MERTLVNPWTWQEEAGYEQAVEIVGAERTLWCAGQTSVDDEGNPLREGDMAAQLVQAVDNLEAVLKHGGYELSDVVRLNFYVTDVDGFFAAAEALGTRMADSGCRAAGTLLEVQRLAFPALLCEIEATAVR